jgi:indolepyruvate ferredoxin oxidoreductase
MNNAKALTQINLEDKYTVTNGRTFIHGVQALARLQLLQKELDRAAGLNTW